MPVPDATEGHVKQNDAEEQLPSVQPKTVHILLGFFFMLNVLLCSGYPGIPFVFYQAGILVATVTLVLVVFIGWNCAIWMVEVMARAQVRDMCKSPHALSLEGRISNGNEIVVMYTVSLK